MAHSGGADGWLAVASVPGPGVRAADGARGDSLVLSWVNEHNVVVIPLVRPPLNFFLMLRSRDCRQEPSSLPSP